MSQRRVRDTSEGESGIALLSGSRACSMRSRIAGRFSAGWACWLPRARKRAPRTELGVTAAAPKAKTPMTTVMKITMSSKGITGSLNLNTNDLAYHEISNGLQRDSGDEQRVADRIFKQRVDESAIQKQHRANNDRGHPHQQGHGQASLRCVDAHLTLNLETFTDDVGEVVENLRQIAARFALQHHRSHKELDVHQRHAIREIHEGVAYWHPELLLLIELTKFSGDGLGHFAGYHFERSSECVPGR